MQAQRAFQEETAPDERVDLLGLDVIQPLHSVLDLPLVRSGVNNENLQHRKKVQKALRQLTRYAEFDEMTNLANLL